MRHYEVMVILDPTLDERTVAPTLDTFLNVSARPAARVEKVDVWGRRRLSYEIKKQAEGIYAVVDLNSEPGRGEGAGPPAQLNETVLRTKVMRREVKRAAAKPAAAKA